MRLRTLATVAILGATLLPPSSAHAVPPANVTVERTQLRTLMLQRHTLVQQLAATDSARGQILTLNALVAADAILSADAAALEHTIRRLTVRPARRRHDIHRKAHRRVKRVIVHTHTHIPVTTRATPALLAAPGVLWSPSARAMAIGLSTTLATTDAAPARRASPRIATPPSLTGLSAPLPFSTTPLLDTATLSLRSPVATGARVPQDASSSGTAAGAPAARVAATVRAVTGRRGSAKAARAVAVLLAPSDAPSHGRLALQGASGAFAIAAANEQVAAAVLTPVPARSTARRHARHVHRKVKRHATARHAKPDPAAQLPGLLRRWHLVTQALGRVRALEQWARANAPAAIITTNDVITSPEVLSRRLDHWTARPALDASMTAQPPSSVAPVPPVAAPSSLLGATFALTGSGGTAPTGDEAVSGTIAMSATTGIVSSTIADNAVSPTAPLSTSAAMSNTTGSAVLVSPTVALTGSPSIVEQPISLTASTALTADILLSSTATSSTATVTPGLPALDATPTTGSGLSPLTPTPGITSSAALSATTGTTGTTGTAITATAPLTAAIPVSATVQPAGAAAMTLSVRQGSPVLSVSAAPSTDSFSLRVTLPVTAEGALAPAGFESERGALESVLRQGQALYADLQGKAAGVEADYRARLRAVVTLNAQIERNYYARYYAWERWKLASATYQQRRVTLNGFLQRRQAAKLARQEWQQREDAYVRALGAYKPARAQAPVVPISGTNPLSSTTTVSVTVPTASEPAAPVPPGPEPPPFTEPMPPFPVPPGPAVPYPGLEPANYALPSPPDTVPPWDGAPLPITPASLVTYGGIARGVNASGYEHMTQDAVLSAGALDGVPSYMDPIKGVITTYFGGSTVFQRFHPGLDIATAEYTPIHAAAAGLVVWAGLAVPGDDHASYGNCIIIKHNDHISTLYAHMDDQAHPLAVQTGDTVQQGQVIGYEGMTGWTTGPHLHFEVRVNNIQVDPLLLIPNPQS